MQQRCSNDEATHRVVDRIHTPHYTAARMSEQHPTHHTTMMNLPESNLKEGTLKADGLRFAIEASRWNDLIVSRLVGGAQAALIRTGAQAEQITLVRVPGSFEIPLAAQKLAANRAGVKAGNQGFEAALVALEMANLLKQL